MLGFGIGFVWRKKVLVCGVVCLVGNPLLRGTGGKIERMIAVGNRYYYCGMLVFELFFLLFLVSSYFILRRLLYHIWLECQDFSGGFWDLISDLEFSLL